MPASVQIRSLSKFFCCKSPVHRENDTISTEKRTEECKIDDKRHDKGVRHGKGVYTWASGDKYAMESIKMVRCMAKVHALTQIMQ